VKGILNILPKNQFMRSVAILAGGTSFAQALPILFAPVLTRLYSPGDFGILAVYTAILILSLNFSSFRYEFAIPISEDNQTAVDLFVLCVVIIILMSLLSFFGIFIFYDILCLIPQIGSLGQYFWLLPVGFLFNGSYHIVNYWAIRERKYSAIALTRISQGFSGLITQLVLGFFKFGSFGLIVGQIIGQCAGLMTLAKQFWANNKLYVRSVSFNSLSIAACRYKDFPLYQSTASLMNSAGLQVPSLIFASCYGVEVAGWFYLTQKVLTIPISLIGTSVSKVFLGEAARLVRDPHKLQRLYKKINFKLLTIGTGPCIILAVSGQWIFKFAFGPQWVQSGFYVQVMAFMFLLKFSTDSVINLAIIERQDLSFIWALMCLVLVVLGILSANWLGLSDFWAVVFFSVAMIFSYIVKYMMWEHALRMMITKKKTAGGYMAQI